MAGIFTSSKAKAWWIFSGFTFLRYRFAAALCRDSSQVFGFHRLLSKRFPYAIYYQIETGNVVVVYRVLDCRQNPRKIRTVLKSGG
jgi:hypothetical protein